MKKVFFTILCLVVFLSGTAMGGTVIAMRGDGTVVFIDDQKEEIAGRVVTGGVAGAMGAVTPDGKSLYVANSALGQYAVSIIDIEKRTLIKNLITGPAPSHVYVSPDGTLAGTGHRLSEDGKIIIALIDTATHSIKHVRIDLKNTSYKGTLTPHVTWTRDSKYLLVPNWADNVVHVVSAQEGKEAVRLQLDGNPHNFNITSDNKELWVAVDAEEDAAGKAASCGKVFVFDLIGVLATPPVTTPKASFCLTTKEGEPREGHHTVLTRDGKFAYSANRGSAPTFGGTSINVFDVETKKLVAHLTAGSNGPGHPFMSPDGKYVVVGHYGANTITIIDAKEHKVVKGLTVGTGKGVQWIAFTPDNKKAFVNNVEDDAVYVIDLKNLEVKKKIETAEPDKKWKTQWHVLNGWYQVYEVVETYVK